LHGIPFLSQKKTPDWYQGFEVWIDRRVPLPLAPGVEGVKIIIEEAERSDQMHSLGHVFVRLKVRNNDAETILLLLRICQIQICPSRSKRRAAREKM
jgi:hypothetical protein